MSAVLLPTSIRAGLPVDLRDRADLSCYDGPPDRPAGEVLDRVEWYVPPYLGPPETLEIMAAMPRLRVVQALTAGTDAIAGHLPAGVTLCNAAGVHDASTAELAVGLVLAVLRGIDDAARDTVAGRWAHVRRPSLADRRVVVVGAGGVGAAVARRLEPFETDVVLVARTARPGSRPPVVAAESLPALLPGADVVVLAVPLDGATRGMADAAFLAAMPDGGLLVNVSRGPVVDTGALLAELRSGRLRAALDVTDPEPLPPDHPLWSAPGVLVTPHVGGDTSAFLPRARRLVAEQLHRWYDAGPLSHVVTPGGPGEPPRT